MLSSLPQPRLLPITHIMSPLKGPGEAQTHDGNPHPIAYILAIIPANWRVPGSKLRIAIVHARWNTVIISALVAGARKSLLQSGVKEENIVIQNVSGSYELPLAVQRIYASSQVESSNNTITSATSAVTGTYGFPPNRERWWSPRAWCGSNSSGCGS